MSPRDSTSSRRKFRRYPGWFNQSTLSLPLTVFFCILILSFAAFSSATGARDSAKDGYIQQRISGNETKLSSRLSAYGLIIQSGAALVYANGINADTFKTYLQTYDLEKNFPAVESVGYDKLMTRDEALAFAAERNAINGNTNIQIPDKPAGSRYLPIVYFEPELDRYTSRIGSDISRIDMFNAAVDQAIQSDQVTLTRQTVPIRSSDPKITDLQPGLQLVAPVYSTNTIPTAPDARASDLSAVIHLSFRTQNFFEEIYNMKDEKHEYLTVYQGTKDDAHKVYQGGTHPGSLDTDRYEQTVSYQGQKFYYEYEFSDSDLLTPQERSRPATILGAGIAVGFMIMVIMLFSSRARHHRLSYEKEKEVQGAKDELLSLASHQLRTPATGVKQYMGMVLQGFAGDITDEQRDFLEKAYDSNERQLRIINDILHLAKLDAGRIVLSKTTFDVSELINNVVDEQREAAEQAEITLKTRIPKKISINADAHMLRMVLENLLSNAIKYTQPHGAVIIRLRMEKGEFVFSVADTGVGVGSEDLDKLFQQFSRIPNDRSHLVSGTGVGLYLVKNLVELHGGYIDVKSTLGKGTTFTVHIP